MNLEEQEILEHNIENQSVPVEASTSEEIGKAAKGNGKPSFDRKIRSTAREIAIHFVFALGFSTDSPKVVLENQLNVEYFKEMANETELYEVFPESELEYIKKVVEGTFLHSPELDEYIMKYAKNWNFARIPRVIAAIMRVGMFESMYMDEIPVSAAVNDAVEIAKGYDEPELVSFLNGVLGSFVREECKYLTEQEKTSKKNRQKKKKTEKTLTEQEQDIVLSSTLEKKQNDE